jgi:hypothetical protein
MYWCFLFGLFSASLLRFKKVHKRFLSKINHACVRVTFFPRSACNDYVCVPFFTVLGISCDCALKLVSKNLQTVINKNFNATKKKAAIC